jgi:hypothetical protein
MKGDNDVRHPIDVNEDTWFYVGKSFTFVHWDMKPEPVCQMFDIPAKLLRSGLAIYDAHRVAKKRRKAKKAAK